jgi:hypothetical protein
MTHVHQIPRFRMRETGIPVQQMTVLRIQEPASYIYIYIYIYKGKAVPLQAWSGPEGSRKIRFPDFMTTAQDGGKVVSLTHRPPLPQEIHLLLISDRS